VAGTIAIAVRMNDGRFMTVQNETMSPAFGKGDLAVLEGTSPSAVKVGDVITFPNPANKEEVLAHRVIATPDMIGEDFYQTKGDATTVPDQPIRAADITGKVNYAAPILGYIVDFLRQPLGLALAIYIPALIILGSEIRRLSGYYIERREYLTPGFDPNHKSPIRHFHFRGPWLTRQS
jgi:signal peptidase I